MSLDKILDQFGGVSPAPQADPRVEAALKQRQEWESQEPIPLEDPLDALPEFPLGCFPDLLARFVGSVSEAVGCPRDYPGCFALGAAAGIVGSTLSLEVKPDYRELSSLFICVVAPPSAGKTPSLKSVCEPIYNEQARRHREKEKIPAYVGDVTVEKLADLMRGESRGYLMVRDELVAWINGMNQYKKAGSDRQFYLAAWSGDPVSVHRKDPSAEPVFVRHPRLSVIGGVQPAVLSKLREVDDGFFDRLLFCYPKRLPAKGEDWRVVSADLSNCWRSAYAALRDRNMHEGEHGRRPYFVRMSNHARREWEIWTEWLAGQINSPDFPSSLQGPAAKLKGYAARIALVLHALHAAYNEIDLETDLRGDMIARGAQLAKYFLAHARQVCGLMGKNGSANDARKIIDWITRNKPTQFTRRDLWRGLRRAFETPETLAGPLKLLVQHGYLTYGDQDISKDKTSACVYFVHPALFRKSGDIGDSGDSASQVV